MIRLNVYSAYSTGESLSTVEDIANLGGIVSVTDKGNISSSIKLQKLCSKSGSRNITGMDLYHFYDDRVHSLKILCKSISGYKNLLKIIETSFKKMRLGYPALTYEEIHPYKEGLVCIVGSVSSALGKSIVKRDRDDVLVHCRTLYDMFGEDLYFMISEIDLEEINEINDVLIKISSRHKIKMIYSNESRYTDREDAIAHAVFVCDGLGKQVDPEFALYHSARNAHLKCKIDVSDGAREIAKKCNFKIPVGQLHMPKFDVPSDFKDEAEYLWFVISSGMRRRGIDFLNTEYMQRIHHEFNIICEMGFAGYFLIVHDFVAFAISKKIPVGPGRGSGAGSLVAYCLNITDIDPIKYDLLFERFLNPERVSMPDFDIDFCKDKRESVIDYMRDKYGHESVGIIGTFTRLKSKGAWRAAARTFGLSPFDQDRVSKLIPSGANLSDAIKTEDLGKVIHEDKQVKMIMDVALKIEGGIKSISKHPAGIVVSDGPLSDYIPVMTQDGISVSQFDMKDVEEAGLIKFDFLGLKTLTIIDKAISMIDDDIEFEDDDAATYAMLSSGRTLGVFQLEGKGITRLMVDMKPKNIEDIIVSVALYRPGPMGSGMLKDYVDVRNGSKKVRYMHPELEDIIGSTNGVIVYQEQVMLIAQRMADYTLGQADILRRAMGKKKPKEMELQKNRFVAGCMKNMWWGDDTEKKASELFDLIGYFSGYGFNRSHSAAYAFIAYRTAYLKANYPSEFISAQIFSRKDDVDDVSKYIYEARLDGLDILYPDVQKSPFDTVCKDGVIMLGLNTIKGITKKCSRQIPKVSPFKGFKSFLDFAKPNKKDLIALCKSGAIDSVMDDGMTRSDIYENAESIIKSMKSKKRDVSQFILNREGLNLSRQEPWSKRKTLEMEREVLGYYRSGHPLDEHRDEIQFYGATSVDSWESDADYEFTVVGVVHDIKVHIINAKDGSERRMAWITLGDTTGKMEATFFADSFKSSEDLLRSGEILVFELKKNIYKGELSAVCNKCMYLSEYRMLHTVAAYTSRDIRSTCSKPDGIPVYCSSGETKRVNLRRKTIHEVFNTEAGD